VAQPPAHPAPVPVHAVIFDYGKVLSLAPTEADWQQLASACGILPVERFQQAYWRFRDEYDLRAVTAFEYWNLVAATAGHRLDEATVRRITALDNGQWTRPNLSMVELARRLRRAGMRTAILSNMQVEMLAALRAKFAWLNEFEAQLYTCEIGVVKPQAEIYLLACRAVSCEPAYALFLDDKQGNIDGALNAGLQALLFDTPERQTLVESYLRACGFREQG